MNINPLLYRNTACLPRVSVDASVLNARIDSNDWVKRLPDGEERRNVVTGDAGQALAERTIELAYASRGLTVKAMSRDHVRGDGGRDIALVASQYVGNPTFQIKTSSYVEKTLMYLGGRFDMRSEYVLLFVSEHFPTGIFVGWLPSAVAQKLTVLVRCRGEMLPAIPSAWLWPPSLFAPVMCGECAPLSPLHKSLLAAESRASSVRQSAITMAINVAAHMSTYRSSPARAMREMFSMSESPFILHAMSDAANAIGVQAYAIRHGAELYER